MQEGHSGNAALAASATPRLAPLPGGRRAFNRRALGSAMAMMAGGLLGPGAASAQDYPNTALRMIVPFAPGGSTDIVARILAQKMGERLGRPVVVENKPGGGTTIGTGIVARAEPDGHTLLYGTNTLATNPALRSNLPYDTVRDLRPVAMVVRQPFVLVVHPSVPADTVGQLVSYARAHPGTINFGSAGIGTGNHLAPELFSILTGIAIQHVPYQGDGPMVTDLVAGRVQMTISTVASLLPHIQAGRLKALGVGGSEPLPQLPGVPPISAGGAPGFEVSGWNAVLVPAATPAGIVARLSETLSAVLADPEVAAALARSGAVPAYKPPEDMGAYLRDEIGRWSEVIRARNIRLD